MSVLIQSLYFVGSYLGIIIILYAALNWLTRGFVTTFLKVRTSRGKKIFTVVEGMTDQYHKPGKFEHDYFTFKSRDGTERTFPAVSKEDVYYMMGVPCIHVNEKDGSIIRRDGSVVSGVTPEEADNAIHRAMSSPVAEDKFKKILLGLNILLLLAVGVAIYAGFAALKEVQGLKAVGVIG